jgi:monoamine oxidase
MSPPREPSRSLPAAAGRGVRLSRRRLLASSGAAALAAGVTLAAPGCRPFLGGGGRGRVAIVGMGLAGLIAAYELERDDFEVVLLEARNQVGGRLRTARSPFYRRQSAEMGGEFIDQNHRVLLGYVRRLGLDLLDLRGLGGRLDGLVYAQGTRRRRSQVVTPDVQAEIDRFDAHVESLAQAVDPADPPAGAAARLDTRSVADVLDELRLDPDARRVVERDLRDDYTVEPDRLSLLFHAAITRLYAGVPDSGIEAFRIDGGNSRILDALVAELRAKVDIEAPVDRIEQGADGVRVHATTGREVDADFCIVAVPLPLLARIDFHPGLPPALAEAAARLQYGAATKVPLQYRRRFWLREGLNGDAITDLPIGTTWEATTRESGVTGILMAYASGEDGRRLAALSDSERVFQASREMETVFPRARGLVEAGATAAWSDEKYSRGSYAAYAPGQVTRYWRALRQPAGRVHFAGEHCDAFTGYMEGAVRSGRRAARAIAGRTR